MTTSRPLTLALAASFVLASASALVAAPLWMRNTTTGCVVTADTYRLVVDLAPAAPGALQPPPVRMYDPTGRTEIGAITRLFLEDRQASYSTRSAPGPAHFHPLRSGPYLIEVHLENLLLYSRDRLWPGLGELTLYCHRDRVYGVASFIIPTGNGFVNRGLYVYPTPPGHPAPEPFSPTLAGFELTPAAMPRRLLTISRGAILEGDACVGVRHTVPEGAYAMPSAAGLQVCARPAASTWNPGDAWEIGGLILPGRDVPTIRQALDLEAAPLPSTAFSMEMGECAGFDPASGLYRLTAQTSGTPDPPPGLRAGTRFTVTNDRLPRTLLVDQRDPWGGIGGGILRDGAGLPLPIVPQFALNFPEHHADAGEPGWATMTYPLDLAPDQSRQVAGEHLYRSLTDREIIYLTSLDNIGDPLLLQTTVGRGESHTLTTGAYPGELSPGNELRINDFRRIYSRERVRSVSAILPTFFGYFDPAGTYHGLMPGEVTFRETSPFLTEYTIQAATTDAAVTGELRVWQAAHSDMTRAFTQVTLRANRDIPLLSPTPARPVPLFFLRQHAFNPMAFGRFGYTGPDGASLTGELPHSRNVAANAAPTGPSPLGALYQALNGLDQGLPCSDITGNAGFVLLDWNVRLGDRAVEPGFYAFSTGAGDVPDGDYARDIALVPAGEPLTLIPAGSTISYRAVNMVWGDSVSDVTVMEAERARWALSPLTLTATRGAVVSSDPPQVAADQGRALVTLTGGADWVPLRVSGMQPGRPLRVHQSDASGDRDLGPGAPGEPWYSAWPEPGGCGFTLLINCPPEGGAIGLDISQ